MKYYIATGFNEKPRFHLVNNMIQEITKGEWELSHDWTVEDDKDVDSYELFAMRALQGVDKADHVFVLLPGGRGTHIELGYALGLDKWISIISFESNLQDSVFYKLKSPIIERYTCISPTNTLEDILKDVINGRG